MLFVLVLLTKLKVSDPPVEVTTPGPFDPENVPNIGDAVDGPS
jgi:hypothetical protein